MDSQNSNLQDLIKGLLVKNLEREIKEGAYTALGQITKNRTVIQRRQEYASEVERVLREARLTIKLIEQVEESQQLPDAFTPEEVINYYSGIFLGQIHQLKDKVVRLVDRMIIIPEEVQDNKKVDPKKAKISKLLDNNGKLLKDIGIYDLLNEWENGGVKVSLSKRTQYHHYVSTLPLDADFQKVRMTRTFLSPISIGMVSEYGKKRLKEIAEESFANLKKNILEKQKSTLGTVERNIDGIAKKLITYYSVPTDDKEVAEIVNAYTKFLSYEDIDNEASTKKIDPSIKEVLDEFIKFNKELFGANLVSIYLVGSVGRGEFIKGSSDINIVHVLKDIPTNGSEEYKNFTAPFDFTFIDEEQLFEENHKKDRFIIWSDGVLLYGKELKINDKDFPKPGTLLTYLLNKDHIEKMQSLREEIESLENTISSTLRMYTLKLIKLVTNFDFGIAMANRPYYSSSREKRIAHINSVFPGEKRHKVFQELYESGYVSKENLLMVIDTVLPNEKVNIAKITNVVEHAKELK